VGLGPAGSRAGTAAVDDATPGLPRLSAAAVLLTPPPGALPAGASITCGRGALIDGEGTCRLSCSLGLCPSDSDRCQQAEEAAAAEEAVMGAAVAAGASWRLWERASLPLGPRRGW
jgi:hypothetical protein